MRSPELEQKLLFPNYNVNTSETLSHSVLVYVNKSLGFRLSFLPILLWEVGSKSTFLAGT